MDTDICTCGHAEKQHFYQGYGPTLTRPCGNCVICKNFTPADVAKSPVEQPAGAMAITPDDVIAEANKNYDLGRRHGIEERIEAEKNNISCHEAEVARLTAVVGEAFGHIQNLRAMAIPRNAEDRQEDMSAAAWLSTTETERGKEMMEKFQPAESSQNELKSERDALQSFVDLMRDEFRRIKALRPPFSDRSEIAELCDRAVSRIDRTVPVTKENAELRRKLKSMEEKLSRLEDDLICAGCGFSVLRGEGDEQSMLDHIKTCEQHPAGKEIARLTAALAEVTMVDGGTYYSDEKLFSYDDLKKLERYIDGLNGVEVFGSIIDCWLNGGSCVEREPRYKFTRRNRSN